MDDKSIFENHINEGTFTADWLSNPGSSSSMTAVAVAAADSTPRPEHQKPVAATMKSGWRRSGTVLLAATVVCGTAMLVMSVGAPSTIDAMPALMRSIWHVGLVFIGIIGLVGIVWRGDLAVGLALQLGSLILLATAASMYAVALFAAPGTAATLAGVSIAAIPVVSLWGAGQIVGKLDGLRQVDRHVSSDRD
ncbi:hypothetical protein BDK92_4957 [Micromonospora pisi]|uniref:Uncharacterized protein n=1 Tax=Micromonospora pisi TaxID=589240 RepID=A0A495JR92_9ACTN|nr:hypothetical protein [Micromonospora pisi]RKR90579.1 hypothetical protein BDK92_4957 [Micromonospora pisi]